MTPPNFKTYYKTTIVKALLYCYKIDMGKSRESRDRFKYIQSVVVLQRYQDNSMEKE